MTVVVRRGASTDVIPPSMTSVDGSPALLLAGAAGAGTIILQAGAPEPK